MSKGEIAFRIFVSFTFVVITKFLLFGQVNPKMPQIATRLMYAVMALGAVVYCIYEYREIRKARGSQSKTSHREDGDE
jgi:type VI protein secretion system component VasK